MKELKYKVTQITFEYFGNDTHVIIAPDKSSEIGMNEITSQDKIYSFKNIKKVNDYKLFFDIGANIGESSVWAFDTFKDINVIAVEPSTFLNNYYKKNLKKYSKKYELYSAAAGTENGYVYFNYHEGHNGGSHTSDSIENDSSHSEKVDSIDLLSLVEEKTKNYKKEEVLMKMDIEGAEIAIIEDERFKSIFSKNIDKLIIELHGNFDSKIKAYEKIIKVLGEKNVSVDITNWRDNAWKNYQKLLGSKDSKGFSIWKRENSK